MRNKYSEHSKLPPEPIPFDNRSEYQKMEDWIRELEAPGPDPIQARLERRKRLL